MANIDRRTTREKISDFDFQVNSFFTSIQESLDEIPTSTTISSSSSSSAKDLTVDYAAAAASTTNTTTAAAAAAEEITRLPARSWNFALEKHKQDNRRSQVPIDKSQVITASKFLQSLHDKLSMAESSLVPLVDLLLDVEENQKGDEKQSSGAESSKSTFQPFFNVEKHVHKLQLSDVSKQIRYLHALHAKQILHIESLLVSQYGYVTSSQQEDAHDSSLPELLQTPSLVGSSDMDCVSPMTFLPTDNDLELQFHSTPMHGHLPRLSEVTMETDGGTPGSILLSNRSSLERTITPLITKRRNNHNHDGGDSKGGGGNLQSLGEESKNRNMSNVVVDESQMNATASDEVSSESSFVEATSDLDFPQTPSLENLHLSAATMNVLQKINQNSTGKTMDKSSCSYALEDSFNMVEIRQACESHFEDSRTGSMFDSCENDESIYDSCCEESLEESANDSSTGQNSQEDDDDMYDATASVASTVVRNVTRLKSNGMDDNKDLTSVDDARVVIERTTDTLDSGRTGEQSSVVIIDQMDIMTPEVGSCPTDVEPNQIAFALGKVDVANVSEKNENSVTGRDLLQDYENVSEKLKQERSNERVNTDHTEQGPCTDKNMLSHDMIVTTSPLDRFQVQVFNGGTECKVTPIGDDIFRSAQSPIMKNQSPVLPSSISSREKNDIERRSGRRSSTEFMMLRGVGTCHEDGTSSYPTKDLMIDISSQSAMRSNKKDHDRCSNENDNDCDNGLNDSEETESFYSSNSSVIDDPSFSTVRRSAKQNLHSNYSDVTSLPSNDGNDEDCKHHSSNHLASESASTVSYGSQKNRSYSEREQSLLNTSKVSSNRCLDLTSSTTSSRTSRAAAFIEKHMADEKDRLLDVLNKRTSFVSPDDVQLNYVPSRSSVDEHFTSESQSINISSVNRSHDKSESIKLEDDSRLINPVNADEYELSPPIIKKLVSRDDLNQGIVLINNWLISHKDEMPSAVPESITLDILGKKFNSSQVKRICLSLCSLQRMMITRKTHHGSGESVMHYVLLNKSNRMSA